MKLYLIILLLLSFCTPENKDSDRTNVLALAALASSSAQTTVSTASTTALSSTQITEMVNIHNQYRTSTSSSIPNLTWSSEIATYAQAWANTLKTNKNCGLEHRSGSNDTKNYGENLYGITGGKATPTNVTKAWYDEVTDYNYSANSCASGKVCGHYTQVVWKNSTSLGCGFASCTNGEVWVCNYNPPGNFVGQKPY
ncbi:MAG: CAP domain-containing protein [Leptospiraceae bacterium]|nr:CAP domain-containing protein [Leptospiraceae bacterium]